MKDTNLREDFGVNVVGMWERGHFQLPEPNALLNNHTVLLLAGMDTHFKKYDQHFGKYTQNHAPVIIIGAGRVGREAAQSLEEMNVPYRVIEKDEFKAAKVKNSIVGDASDKVILERAGINKAPAVLITSHDDESNIYLTIYCRKLRLMHKLLPVRFCIGMWNHCIVLVQIL